MNRAVIAIAAGALAAGVLDIIYAFVVFGPLSYGLSAQDVLHSIAAGWIGRDAALAGGWNTAWLGLGSHFLITAIMAAAYVMAAQSMKMLTKNALLWGFLYGLALYVAMNHIVVPLSAAGPSGHFASTFGEAMERLQTAFSAIRPTYDSNHPWLIPGTILTHTVLVGIPIALSAKHFAVRPTEPPPIHSTRPTGNYSRRASR